MPPMEPRAGHRSAGNLLLVVLVAAFLGCGRDPLPRVCPDLAYGALAISEIRGGQSGFDTGGQWIEFYNASGGEAAVGGLDIRLALEDVTGVPVQEASIVVLDPDLAVQPGGYLVMGRFPEDDLPPHVDFGFESQFASSLYESGCGSACESMLKDGGCPPACRNACEAVCTSGNCPAACNAASGLPECADCAPLPCQDVCAEYETAVIEVSSCGVLVDRVEYFTLPGTGTWSFDGAAVPDADANDDMGRWCVDDTADAVGGGAPGTPKERNRPCSR